LALTSGTRLGPYEIVASVGAGGMGEVYRARDTRLDRTVALKVLPSAFSSDSDRLQRFQYEARILSTLNHSNVLAIHDVGDQNGIRYLVSEFLEGETLRDKMAAGPLSRRRVLEYALEIARGLAAAHDKGIIHRDLKPDNIFITRDDRVKILDFGLAKRAFESGPNETITVTTPAPTAPGTVLGTVGYMSPEQVRGQPLDHRSDVFSFGAILYEMVSGKRAFHGDSGVETMNAILKEDVPELTASSTNVAPGIERIIRRCLEKQPERRFQSASDLAFALEALSGGSTGSQVVSAALQAPSARKNWLAWILAGIVALALIAAGLYFFSLQHASQANFTQITFRSSYIRTARFTPGRYVVYGATINGEPMQIFSTHMDTLETQPLNIKADLLDISSTSDMALSLDRTFETTWVPIGRLARAPMGGGATRELVDNVNDADWTPDGSQLAISHQVNGKFRLEFPPGKVLFETSGYISDVRFSPKGDQIAFLEHPMFGDDRGYVDVVDLQGNRKVLAGEYSSEQGLAWTPKGDELWYTATTIAEAPVMRAVDLHGRRRVVFAAPMRLHLQDIAKDGKVLLSTELLRWQIGVADVKTGHQLDTTAFQWPMLDAISRDGSLMLINSFDTGSNTNYRLYVQRTDGSTPVLIGEGAGTAFSFDGKWVTAITPTKTNQIQIIPTGVGETQTLHVASGSHYLGASFFPDGKRLLVVIIVDGQQPQAAIQEIATGALHAISSDKRFVPNSVGILKPGVSPDGKFCILTDASGRYWLQPLDGSNGREITGLKPEEEVTEWRSGSGHVFVSRFVRSDVEVYDVDLSNGQRKLWTRFSPADKTALVSHSTVFITPDGGRYGYLAQRIYSTLFLANELR